MSITCSPRQVPGVAEEGDRTRSVTAGPVDEGEFGSLQAVTGEGVGRGGDIALAVLTNAEREQLHHLPRKVLVGMGGVIGRGVQPDHHRRILRHGLGQRVERAGAGASEKLVLLSISCGSLTLAIPVAKCPCHRRVSFSRSGVEVTIIRFIHQSCAAGVSRRSTIRCPAGRGPGSRAASGPGNPGARGEGRHR